VHVREQGGWSAADEVLPYEVRGYQISGHAAREQTDSKAPSAEDRRGQHDNRYDEKVAELHYGPDKKVGDGGVVVDCPEYGLLSAVDVVSVDERRGRREHSDASEEHSDIRPSPLGKPALALQLRGDPGHVVSGTRSVRGALFGARRQEWFRRQYT
jgi:hypothetical protein